MNPPRARRKVIANYRVSELKVHSETKEHLGAMTVTGFVDTSGIWPEWEGSQQRVLKGSLPAKLTERRW